MKTPIYKNNNAPGSLPKDANTGLWFDKFCNQWPANGWSLKSVADKNPKLDWIRTVAGKAVGDKNLLDEHKGRIAALARACGGEVLHFKTASRFATGLGREHPIENGFVCHPALGTPFLSGSSVKGLVRAWAATWLETDGGSVSRIFGPRDSREVPANIGSVIFFDALPSKPVKLDADVMTPHYGPYYERGEVPATGTAPCPSPSSPYRLARVSSLLSRLAHYPTLIALTATPPSGGSKTRCLNSVPARKRPWATGALNETRRLKKKPRTSAMRTSRKPRGTPNLPS